MALVSLFRLRPEPGRLADHLAESAELVEHVRRLGYQAANWQALVGGDVGTTVTTITAVNSTDFAAGMQKSMADDKFQEFMARASTSGSATVVETSQFNDVDPNFQPNPDRPTGFIQATQWRPSPGHMADFMSNVTTAVGHISRLGGAPRVMASIFGAHPLTVLVSVGLTDFDAYGAYADAVAGDEQFQTFWAGALANPSAELIRSGLYLNLSN
ncbi:MAG TPA: hypothetical protein VK461_02275 [Acidimicrobiales bacterium]|nr:hypothetical protein [Acidimicrobiales bacterium]